MLTDIQSLIQQTARDFAQDILAPRAHEWDESGEHPEDVIQQMGELGFYGVTVPEEWGGTGAGYEAMALAVEEVAAGDGGCSTIVSVMNSVVCGPLLKFGTEQQKNDYLVPMASGDMLGAFCLSEPQAGSDAVNLKTKAVLDGDEWVINGTKQFITNGMIGRVAIVFAVTDPSAGKKGISAFLVPAHLAGYEVARVEKKMGQRASDTAQIVLTDVRVSKDHLLGKEGEGYKIALANLEGGRIGIAAQSVGMARAAYQHALAYAQDRTSFGKTLMDHQAVSFRLANMATQIEAARQLVMHSARLKDANEPCLKEACMAKLFASEMAERVCSDAIQVLGGYGYLNDFPVERIYRDVRVTQIYEGTSDIQKMVISREIAKEQ